MKDEGFLRPAAFLGLMLLCAGLAQAQRGQPPEFPTHPDSVRQEGVPQGEMIERQIFESSKIFPGTYREYSIYVPAQYKPDQPACVYVNQDGPTPPYNANIVFDNLIAKKEMPVTIGIFVRHGSVKAADPNSALDRFNRSFEYDGLGDNYVRFLIEELLPEVETKKTSDGRAIRLSKNANDRAIGGSSSGAIAAFTAAWERPDAFSRVFSSIGTYVGLRGGDEYPTLIRKYEPKPIRIFLEDGSTDQNIYAGDWWFANQMMERALIFSGYEVTSNWGPNGHNGAHAASIFPDAMRFLWKDYPAPVKAGESKNAYLTQILIPGEGWKLIGEGYGQTQGACSNAKGEVFFNDVTGKKTFRIGLDGKPSVILTDSRGAKGMEFGPDGKRYVVIPDEQKIIAYDPDGRETTVAEGVRGQDICVTNDGKIYVTNPPVSERRDPSNLFLIKSGAPPINVDSGIDFGSGVTVTPDKTLLYVSDHRSHWVYSYSIKPDGTLINKQQYGWLHVPDFADKSGGYAAKVDQNGRLYVASYMGVQVLDQLGRVNAILPPPVPRGTVFTLCFGGEKMDTLFVATGDKVFSRKLKVQGSPAWGAPIKPQPTGL